MQLKRVEAFIKKHRLLKINDTVIVAVSGGPDSLCLLHILYRLRDKYNLKLVVAHLNHGLRPEALEEAQAVEELARDYTVCFEKKEVDIKAYKKENHLSEEEAGRRARYNFFHELAKKYKATVIALGHHYDDQVETVLFNIIRGTGPDGLAGILPARSEGMVKLIRPLLFIRRSEIEDYCRLHNLKPSIDRSNLETGYTRNKLRLELIPYLEEQFNPRICEALFGLSELARYDRQLLRFMAVKKYKQLATKSSEMLSLELDGLLKLPQSIRGRVLKLALAAYIPGKKLNRLHIERLNKILEQGNLNARLSLPHNVEALITGKSIILRSSSNLKVKKFNAISLNVPGKAYLPGGIVIAARVENVDNLTWPPLSCQAYLDFERLPVTTLKVQPRWPGARFHPHGASGSKKLKDFLIDQKVPEWRRDYLPLVTAGDEILWVAGVRIAHPYMVTAATKKVLLLELKALKRPKKIN